MIGNCRKIRLMKIQNRLLILFFVFFLASAFQIDAQRFNSDFGKALKWRNVGPFRGGRTRAVCGVASEPNVFYMAQSNGGVWKTTDFGRTWSPIFDEQPTGSIGALAVSVSNPNVIYAGSGEGLHRPDLSVGDGVYKSVDAGKTWRNVGLRDGQQIAEIAVDPRDENKVLVAVAGHPYGANAERGIYRTGDGGKTWEKVLGRDENVGAWDVVFDVNNPETAYASLWESREGPWENARFDGINGGIFKSTDGGKTWTQLKNGLPEAITQASLAVAPSNSKKLFAAVRTPSETKFYISADAGASWKLATDDARPAARIAAGDLGDVQFDPKNENVIYAASVVAWRSVDGGRTWTAFRGAPGGDDYQNIWINPNNPEIILMGSDQGAIITVNGGRTWSSWYNQPTAQMYHVSADNAFPYRLCSGQQESGSACVESRGDYGKITMREWSPVAAEEYGYVVADPLNPDIVYGGKLTRFDRRTKQAVNILPKIFRGADWRMLRTQPVVFSPVDNKTLYFAGNTLWKTTNGGDSWTQISEDLTRKTWEVPPSVGKFADFPAAKPTQRGVIYAVAPSFKDINTIWVGTDDGLIHRTTDGGKNWENITPPFLRAWQKVSIIEAGHFDNETAYAAINTLRLDDNRPHIYRTRDGGKTWTEIVKGIPEGQTVNVVREDSLKKGLLFAGTERTVYVSFDDGENWQSLRFNLPATSVRDLIVKDDDIAIGTHGRGFWILDNITPLRQLSNKDEIKLFKPQTALRVRWSLNPDTPLPPDEPAGENPPDGAMIDYYLPQRARRVELEIKDRAGNVIRRYTSADKPPYEVKDTGNIPSYWIRPPQILSAEAGLHRFLWDVHYQPIENATLSFPISAVENDTAPEPTAPWALPGDYTIVLIVDGKNFSQPLTLKIDPRVKTSPKDLQTQFDLSKQLYDNRARLEQINQKVGKLSQALIKAAEKAKTNAAGASINRLDEKLQELTKTRRSANSPRLSFGVLERIENLFVILQQADAAPTVQTAALVRAVNAEAENDINVWRIIENEDLPALNKELQAAGFAPLDLK
jgi:photosystem II stability/assembly factor-like uncharacterized protein